MNRYSKIKLVNTTKSRSMDFSDLQSFPDPTKPIETPNPNFKTLETKQIKTTPSDVEYSEDGSNKDVFGLKLSRNSSISSTTSHRFRLDKQTPTPTSIQSAVKRAFSMRRSSSVSERYCRIHDQCVTQASPLDDDDDIVEGVEYNAVGTARSMKGKKVRYSSGRILKTCKRFFGL